MQLGVQNLETLLHMPAGHDFETGGLGYVLWDMEELMRYRSRGAVFAGAVKRGSVLVLVLLLLLLLLLLVVMVLVLLLLLLELVLVV